MEHEAGSNRDLLLASSQSGRRASQMDHPVRSLLRPRESQTSRAASGKDYHSARRDFHATRADRCRITKDKGCKSQPPDRPRTDLRTRALNPPSDLQDDRAHWDVVNVSFDAEAALLQASALQKPLHCFPAAASDLLCGLRDA